MAKSKKTANGQGSIRKKSIDYNGKTHTYYEARYTEGYDPGTGKQLQRSITGKTQKEVAAELRKITTSIDDGSYTAPNKITVGQWMEIWASDYLGEVKEGTAYAYKAVIRNHICPSLGATRLSALQPHMLQEFINQLSETRSPKTVKNIYGVLHSALNQAVLNKLIPCNPLEPCKPPKVQKPEMHFLDDEQIARFVEMIRGERFERIFYVTLFTGMRKGEVLGLTWDCVDFTRGTVLIDKQLQRPREGDGTCVLVPTKTDKPRKLMPAKSVMEALKRVKLQQTEWQLLHGELYQNSMNLVFTNELGGYLNPNTVYNDFKAIVTKMGVPELRFHDLRHSYAAISLMAGDDIKTLQVNLGHASTSFTLDVYGHVPDQMKQESADRMEQFIRRKAVNQSQKGV